MDNVYDPHNLSHYCGGGVKTTEFEGEWSAVCRKCGATRSGCKTAEELMLAWYDLKPERDFGKELDAALERMIAYLLEHDEEIYSRELLAVAGQGGARVLEILDNAGLVTSRFEIEDENTDASFQEAKEAKKKGKPVRVFCRRNFKPLEQR